VRNHRNLEQYFATLPSEEIVDELHHRIRDYYLDVEQNGLFWVWKTSYASYYGATNAGTTQALSFDTVALHRSGRNGELTNLKLNHARNLIKHVLQLTTANKPALNCRANNTDYKSQSQCLLANGLLDYYFREKKVGWHLRRATETSLVFGEAFIHMPWNPNAGEKYRPDPLTGEMLYEGDLAIDRVLTPLDVPRDVHLTHEANHDWYLVREYENKWDLARRHPQFWDNIVSGTAKDHDYELTASYGFNVPNPETSDLACVWTFYHRPTESVPKGRMVVFCGDDCLLDGPLPYEKIPVERISPEPLIGTIYGWSPAFELLAGQQALDIVNSTIMTNNATFGVQSIWTKTGDTVQITQLGRGLQNFQSEELPQAVQLTKTAPETYEWAKSLEQQLETLSGVSSTVRGNPEASLKSGAALALVVSQAVQFASLLEASYTELIESVGYGIVSTLRDFAKTERVAAIVGEANRSYLKKFTADDLRSISRVSVEPTNALSKTISGRLELAERLSDRGMIDNAREYLTVLQTGQLEPLIEGSQAELLNIRAENEALRNSQQVVALVTDNHAEHILEHKAILSTPEARSNPEIVNAVLAHVQEHLDQWRNADPAILAVTGQQPAPVVPVPPPPPGQTPVGAGPVQAPPAPNPLAAQEPQQPNLPSLPPNSPPEAQQAYEQVAGLPQV
jgi:hypothetical protein